MLALPVMRPGRGASSRRTEEETGTFSVHHKTHTWKIICHTSMICDNDTRTIIAAIYMYLVITSLGRGRGYWQLRRWPSLDSASLIARFMGPTWGPPGADRTQVGPMWVPWKLLSGLVPWIKFSAHWHAAKSHGRPRPDFLKQCARPRHCVEKSWSHRNQFKL